MNLGQTAHQSRREARKGPHNDRSCPPQKGDGVGPTPAGLADGAEFQRMKFVPAA